MAATTWRREDRWSYGEDQEEAEMERRGLKTGGFMSRWMRGAADMEARLRTKDFENWK